MFESIKGITLVLMKKIPLPMLMIADIHIDQTLTKVEREAGERYSSSE
jgi:hypothetical protein